MKSFLNSFRSSNKRSSTSTSVTSASSFSDVSTEISSYATNKPKYLPSSPQSDRTPPPPQKALRLSYDEGAASITGSSGVRFSSINIDSGVSSTNGTSSVRDSGDRNGLVTERHGVNLGKKSGENSFRSSKSVSTAPAESSNVVSINLESGNTSALSRPGSFRDSQSFVPDFVAERYGVNLGKNEKGNSYSSSNTEKKGRFDLNLFSYRSLGHFRPQRFSQDKSDDIDDLSLQSVKNPTFSVNIAYTVPRERNLLRRGPTTRTAALIFMFTCLILIVFSVLLTSIINANENAENGDAASNQIDSPTTSPSVSPTNAPTQTPTPAPREDFTFDLPFNENERAAETKRGEFITPGTGNNWVMSKAGLTVTKVDISWDEAPFRALFCIKLVFSDTTSTNNVLAHSGSFSSCTDELPNNAQIELAPNEKLVSLDVGFNEDGPFPVVDFLRLETENEVLEAGFPHTGQNDVEQFNVKDQTLTGFFGGSGVVIDRLGVLLLDEE